MMRSSKTVLNRAIASGALVVAFCGTALGGDKFGDSTATAARICMNNTVILGKYLSAAGSGVLDSMRIWARNNDGGTDTVVACIYSSVGALLGRSRDSALVPNDNLSPYMLRFDNQSIDIPSNTRFWIGAQFRVAGGSSNTRVGTATSADTLFLGTDLLPLESSLPTGSKYFGAGVEAVRVTAYYSTHGDSRIVTRRRRAGSRAELDARERKLIDETYSFGPCDSDSPDGDFSRVKPGFNSDRQQP